MNNYYDVLNVVPDATRTEVVESYQRIKKIFSDEQLAIYGLFTKEILSEKIQEIELAYQVLSDTSKRDVYDRELKERGLVPMTAREGIILYGALKKPEEEKPPEIKRPESFASAKAQMQKDKREEEQVVAQQQVLPENINGAVLAKIRRDKEISLDDIYQETKIKVKMLEELESDAYEKLPAKPYLRGFLIAYASFLKIDADRVVKDYLKAYDEWVNSRRHNTNSF